MKQYTSLVLSVLFAGAAVAQNLADFTQVGPVKFPANPSVQTTGMGRVSHMAYHPTDSNVLFAVSSSGGVFKTANEGVTWNPISDDLPPTYCASIVINPLNPNVMYLGTGDANYGYRGGYGVWKTTDGGETWFQSTTGIGNKLVSYIRITPGDTTTLVAACADGIYKSKDAGASWIKKTTTSVSYRDLHYQPGDSNILYSASNTRFYRSFDNGESWSETNINSSITCAGIKITTCPADTSKLYCLVWKGGSSPFGGVYKSTNNGGSFTLMSDKPNILGYSSVGTSTDGQGAYNLAIQSDPADADVIYVGAITLWKSTNGGDTFKLNSPWAFGVHADKHGFLFSPYNTNKLYVYHDGGVDRTTDGGQNWTTMEDGLSASEFYTLGASDLYNNNILGGLQDNGLDVAIDKDFKTIRGGDWGGDFAFDAFDKDIVYENGGIKRNLVTNAGRNINGHGGVYAVHPNDSNVMFEATSDDLYRTTNLRADPSTDVSWTNLSTFFGVTRQAGMSYAKASSGTFYVAYRSQKLFRSTDINAAIPAGPFGSMPFTELTNFPYQSGEQIKQVETSDQDSNAVYIVTTQSRILSSHDKGLTWSVLTRNLPSVNIIKFVTDPNATDSSMYICNAFGVYYRNKFASNWIPFAQGLPTVSKITDMEIMNDGTADARLHISMWGRGIWQTDLYKNSSVAPTADFKLSTASNQSCVNNVIVVDNSTGSPLGRTWAVYPTTGWEYVNGTDANYARPEIKFNIPGVYSISLSVQNSLGSDLMSQNYTYSPLSVDATCTTTTTNLGGYTIGVRKFELNSIDKASSTGNITHEDFSCEQSTLLKPNTLYTAWVTVSHVYAEKIKMYIDYNDDGDFLDANELVATLGSGLSRRAVTFTTPVSIPVANKFIRLRVVTDYSSGIASACDALTYGQSEDYAVFIDNIVPTVTIDIPTPMVSNEFKATFTTSEKVSDFESTDIYVANANVSQFTQVDLNTYTALITPTANGQTRVGIIGGSITDVVGNTNAAFTVNTNYFLGIDSFTFTGVSEKDSIFQTPLGGSITSYVPFGTSLDALTATFTLSDTTTAYIGTTLQTSATTVNDFNVVVTYTTKAKNEMLTSEYTVDVIVNENTACELLSYNFAIPSATGAITPTVNGGTVTLEVPYGTSLSNLVANFTISDSATVYISSIEQMSGSSANDFSATVTYIVVAQNTDFSNTYTVNVQTAANTACELLTYGIETPASTGTITGPNVDVIVPYGTPVENLIALFTVSDNASVSVLSNAQTSGVSANDFTNAVTYVVTAENTAFSKTYTVSVHISDNQERELLTFDIVTPASAGIITTVDTANGTVAVDVPFGTSVDNLIAIFTTSDSATVTVDGTEQESGITANDFTANLDYTVTAQDNRLNKVYVVTVNILPNTEAELIDFSILSPATAGTITRSDTGGLVELMVSTGTNLTSLVAQFSVSENATATVDGLEQTSTVTANNYSDTLKMVVISEDNNARKTYNVVINKSASSIAKVANGRVNIYPNPASSEIRIKAVGRDINNETYTISDATGQIVTTNTMSNTETVISIADLARGIYYINIQTDEGKWIGRFLKE